ncbi:MAG TPA: glycosyltransferase family 2 protein [Flavipsychrobacter sp.]|nr:glycosyltransferase family 2 protein [Flavipsychrobacter sp.]
MCEDPLVTIAIVAYNSERYISMAIDSVLSSNYRHFELIISDDNSKDKTWSIIQSYDDPRIRAMRNVTNLGEYPNREQCIRLAKGEYFIFIDGDDMMYPHGLEFMTRMLHAFPQCAMALMWGYKSNLFYPVVVSPQQFFQGIYFRYGLNSIAFANTFFRTSVLKEEGKFRKGTTTGDACLRMKIGRKYPLLLISDQLTFWRETPGQASSRLQNNFQAITEHFDRQFEQLLLSPLSDQEKVLARRNLRIQVIYAVVGLIKKLRVREAHKLLRHYHLSPAAFRYYLQKPTYMDPFSDYTPDNVFMQPISKNPFSKGDKPPGSIEPIGIK